MKRLYIGELDINTDAGNAIIIASTAREAKKLAYAYFQDMEDPEWTEVKVKWKRNANIDGLPDGICTDWIELIRRDIVSNCWGVPCPVCRKDILTIEKWGNTIACTDCLERLSEYIEKPEVKE